MHRITFQDFYDNYLVKNGEPGNEEVFYRPPALLKKELDDLGDLIEQLINNTHIPQWDQNTVYDVNELCVLDGVIYVSLIDDNIGHEPPNPTYWKKLIFPASGGTLWIPGTEYSLGDIVNYSDEPGSYNSHGTTALYYCTVPHTSVAGQDPYSLLGSKWEYANASWFGANKYVIHSGDPEPTSGVRDGDILIIWS